MAILGVTTSQTGTAGVLPSLAYIATNDPVGTIITTGYLNKVVQNGTSFSLPCIAAVTTQESSSALPITGWYAVQHSGVNWNLVDDAGPGTVTLPTILNHIATYSNTNGGLTEDASTAINGGNIQAGLSGTAGALYSFPGTAAKGKLIVAGVANTGNTDVTLSNVAHGQATVYSIPDAGGAVGRMLVANTATPFTTAHLLASSGTGGLVVDSGVATAAVQLSANIKAAQVTSLGGAGAGPITVTAAGVTTASVICVDIITSSNTVSVAKVTPGTGNFALLLSGDPGAVLTISYVAFIAAQ